MLNGKLRDRKGSSTAGKGRVWFETLDPQGRCVKGRGRGGGESSMETQGSPWMGRERLKG